MTDSMPLIVWLEGFGADELSFMFSMLLVIGYYTHFRIQARKDSTYSIHSVNALARRLWTQNVMTNAGKDIMAVQTLRNFIMVGIMMASTASSPSLTSVTS